MSSPGDGDGPYRSPGDAHLGRILQRFAVMRRPRYQGSARAVGRRPFGPGALLPSSTLASSPSESTRRPSGEAVELCERGLRIVARAGILELTWDQITGVRRIDDPSGLVGLVLTGIHGEDVHFDRSLRGLGELADAVDRARGG